MKTKHLLLMLTLVLVAITFGNALTTSSLFLGDPEGKEAIAKDKAPKVLVKVDMGCKKKDCEGFCLNVCAVYIIIIEGLQGDPNGAIAELSLSDTGRPVLSFPREKLDPDFEQNFLGGGSFRLEESFELSHDIASELGKNSLTLPAGEFPIRQNSDHLEVEF
jgi:hypothetical protein